LCQLKNLKKWVLIFFDLPKPFSKPAILLLLLLFHQAQQQHPCLLHHHGQFFLGTYFLVGHIDRSLLAIGIYSFGLSPFGGGGGSSNSD